MAEKDAKAVLKEIKDKQKALATKWDPDGPDYLGRMKTARANALQIP